MKCTKVKFRTEVDADFHIDKKAKTAKKSQPKCSSYFCPYCNNWHITSQPDFKIIHYERQIKNLKSKILHLENEVIRLTDLSNK